MLRGRKWQYLDYFVIVIDRGIQLSRFTFGVDSLLQELQLTIECL